MKNFHVSTAYVLLNSDLGSDESIINEVKQVLTNEDVKFEIQGVYGVYDIVLKLSSDNAEKLRGIITNKIRKISKVQSTLTMMVIEEQENS
jgi:DNA-binding Lrp family transcriptional regulator